MEILSTTRPSFRVENYSREQSANNSLVQEPIADAMSISPRSDGAHRILLGPFSFIMADGGKLEGFLKTLNTSGLLDEMKTIQARRELLVHDVQKRMHVLDDMFSQNPELKSKALSPAAKELVYSELDKKRNAYAALISSFSNTGLFSTLSSKEINDLLSTAIGEMSESYLDVFQQAVEKNAQFYKDFSDFMSTLPQFISADGDKTILDGKKFRESLEELMGKYPVPGMSTTLFPVQTGSTVQGASYKECEDWAREFGLSADDCISQLLDGTYIVHIDISPLENIYNSVEDKSMSFNAAQWSAWQTGVDMQKDHIQNSMQTLTQKFANAHSTFDNLVKVLSSTISSLLECDKQFFV
ncbi:MULTISPECIES: IpaD/SipD/SspD family type III secretion system needle tip protein [unclassified Symbiopectobacterium]|uniref:IpaD/SipD/SspD family type III secretion system needle tip protein n=1 Tax=unclassified Symbiopectobacterium TaxID=2794573 RepID=UPI002225D39C|nr:MULTISPECIES: IpaD/SipD/SspD family type III secretion system needle tip protein [unclassified Symbiopectobacterium]MCW2477113.1 IpaD/SipD/SspD family type III secretion system needle tip protein [Candidatus Symbiopectobacterium sp. NZEC151]MCW2488541.1 IpaD/SipD/SspD family type III secretion system needle tip protein [Candidatus Symbiopectobacterium sp. NZEC127]